MVPFSIIFHFGFSVPRGLGALRAIVLRAGCLLEYITVDVLSPKLISCLERELSSSAFSEPSLSVEAGLSECESFCFDCFYCTLRLGLESCCMSLIAARISTGCFSSLRSDAKFLIYFYVMLCLLGFDTMHQSAVFGFLPKCASKGAIFVTLLMLCIMSATIVDMSSDDHSWSNFITPSLRFMIWINPSTFPVAL